MRLRNYIILFSLLFSSSSCVTAPETERRQFIIVPDSQMLALGSDAYDEILKQEQLATDQSLVDEVKKIGQRVAEASGHDLPWEFQVIQNDDMINAFCLPGGKVGIYTGIIPIARTNAGLAAVIGHEVAHATLKHGAERMSQMIASQVGLSLAALSLENFEYRNEILAAMGIGAQLGIALPYSRYHEREADLVGLRYMARAGYDPREAVELWKRMQAASNAAAPEFLSTHPNPAARIQYLEESLAEVMAIYEASEKQTLRTF